MGELRGKTLIDEPLSPFTWLRVGGPADRLFIPADTEDLIGFLKELPDEEPLTVIGVGSNLLVRDGGLRGTVVRLGPGYGRVEVQGTIVSAGAAALDATVAKRAAAAGIGGLEFYRGIPGTIGGALRMNAGAYGTETKDVLIDVEAIDRTGARHVLSADDIDYAYRSCPLPADWIFVGARFQGSQENPEIVTERMNAIMARREQTQPVKEKTGGSTFKNPDPALSDGKSSWQLIEAIGGRGRVVGGAQMSPLHCNFMINANNATAADLEALGEGIRADVRDKMGVELSWEIKRIGEPL